MREAVDLDQAVSLEIGDDGIAILELRERDGRPFILDVGAVGALEESIERLRSTPRVRGLLVRGGGRRVFCAGADVDAIAELTDPNEAAQLSRRGQDLFDAIEHLPYPAVACIHGACLGGGLELALACHLRLVSDDASTRLGLPEVRLGIVPAWGGSTRLVEVVGLRAALPLLLSGSTVDARKALRIGLAIESAPKENLAARARARLEAEIEAWHHGHHSGPIARKQSALDYLVDEMRAPAAVLFAAARRRVAAESKGRYPAPTTLLDILQRGQGRDRETRFALEREAISRLVKGRVCKNLVSIFRRTRDRDRGGLYARAAAVRTRIDSVAVVGAGVMGAGIAAALLVRGKRVRLIDPFHDALVRARRSIDVEIDKLETRRRIDRREARSMRDRLMFASDLDGIAGAHLIIEAVPELIELKHETLREIGRRAADDAVIATNTSSLSVTDLAAACGRPHRFAGLHFFNPAPKMPLVEVVRTPAVDEDVLLRLLAFVKDIGKTAVLCADRPAFVVNRLLAPYLIEAVDLLARGAEIADIDRAARGFGLPMGPFELMDTVGLDVTAHVSHYLANFPELGLAAPSLVDRLVERRELGKKSGRGFLIHRGRKATPRRRAELVRLDPTLRESSFASNLDAKALRDRLLGVLEKEAGRVLDEGVVASGDDLDLATIYGMGFPPWTGGLASWLHAREEVER